MYKHVKPIYFKNNLVDEIQPKFYSQGSFAVGTILNPIVDDEGLAAYDLDDGVYFNLCGDKFLKACIPQ